MINDPGTGQASTPDPHTNPQTLALITWVSAEMTPESCAGSSIEYLRKNAHAAFLSASCQKSEGASARVVEWAATEQRPSSFPPGNSGQKRLESRVVDTILSQILTPESITFNRFLKLILLEHKPLLACFGFVTRQKWLVSGKINFKFNRIRS